MRVWKEKGGGGGPGWRNCDGRVGDGTFGIGKGEDDG